MSEFIITEHNCEPPAGQSKGLVDRNYEMHPVGYNSKPFALPLIPESEWQGRLNAQLDSRSRLSDIRKTGGPNGGLIPARDQNGKGYCWNHSVVGAMLLTFAKQGQPYADLSAYAGACIIKNYRDEGGWGAAGLEWNAVHGCPTSATWPQKSMSRSNDTPAMRAEAMKYRVTEWMDLEPRNKAQFVTCLLMGIPVVSDFSWWGHSVVTMDLVSLNPFKTLILNSWGNWGDKGEGFLEGSKAIPDGMIAPFSGMGS